MWSSELDEIVTVHIQAFPGFFLTRLGKPFLREYYSCIRSFPGGILLTERQQDRVVGFVAGFVDPSGFYQTLRARRIRLGFAAARSVIRHPGLLVTAIADYRRTGDAVAHETLPSVAELSSLAVQPHATEHGLGARLVSRFIVTARSMGATRVGLTTDADGNDRVNRFYCRLGFACVRTFRVRSDRVLNEYLIETANVESP